LLDQRRRSRDASPYLVIGINGSPGPRRRPWAWRAPLLRQPALTGRCTSTTNWI